MVFEDEYVLAFDKPSGMYSVSGKSNGSIEELIKSFCKIELGSEQEFGLLQRLDFETQGVVLIAKTTLAYQRFKELIAAHGISKSYECLLPGGFDGSKTVRGFIGSKARRGAKVYLTKEMPAHGRALEAETKFELIHKVLENRASLVLAKSDSGRRHQIRVSAASIGAPLIGDTLYGSTQKLPEELSVASGFYLLASEVVFTHPVTSQPLKIKALERKID